jgi:erythritol kinase
MRGDILIAIDAGTSVIKTVAFSLAGDQLAIASRPNSYATPGPGQVEQDMPRTWADCAASLRELQEPTAHRSAAACSGSIRAPPRFAPLT